MKCLVLGKTVEDWSRGRPVSKKERWEPPVKDDPRWWRQPTVEDFPNFHEESAYTVTSQSRLIEGG